MNFENYTDRARGFVQAAQSIAVRDGHQRFLPEHVLKALLDDPEGMSASLIQRAGGDPSVALQEIDAALARQPSVSGDGAGQLYLAPETARVFETAEKLSKKAGDSYVTAERMLQAIAMEKSEAADALKQAGVTPAGLNKAIDEVSSLLEQSRRKLGNSNFRERAPAEIVAKEEEKAAEFEARLARLQTQLEELG